MSFQLPVYQMPDFTLPQFVSAPNAAMAPAPRDGVAPEGFHSTGIDPEYFKIDGKWTLAPEIRMDCVPVLRDSGVIDILEFRRLKQGDLVIQGRTRETGFSRDYREIVELLQHEKQNGGHYNHLDTIN